MQIITTVIYFLTPVRIAILKKQKTSIAEKVEGRLEGSVS